MANLPVNGWRMETKVCKCCEKAYPVNQFPIANYQAGKLYRKTTCRPCSYKADAERMRKRRAAARPPAEIMLRKSTVNLDYSSLINSIVRPMPCSE